MARADEVNPNPSGFRLLSDAQLDQIRLASLEILRRTGVRVYDAEALELLSGAGCVVTDGDLVKFPPAVVEEALDKAPSRIVLCSRTGEPAMYLEAHRTYFGTGSDLPNTLDLETGERRPSLLSDVEQTARLVDSLPNVEFVMSMAQASDVEVATSDRKSFLAMLTNTTKPIVFTAWDEHGLADIIAMAQTVAGGRDELALSPFLFAYLEPTSPLQHSDVVLRKMMMMIDQGLPFVYAPGPIEGASVPITSAGSLATANAEILSGMAIAQLKKPGTPVLFGSGSGPLDMRTTLATYSSPEFMHHCMAMAELGHYRYDLPVWGFSGCTDSKLADHQASIESTLWILWTALSGANLVHDLGYVESGMTCSYEMIVLCDEIVSYVRRLMEGFQITPETLALDAIDEVGPGNDFLGHAHTLRHFREVWQPRVLDRNTYQGWVAADKPTAFGNAREMARQAVAEHRCEPLSDAVLETLQELVAEADKRAGVAG